MLNNYTTANATAANTTALALNSQPVFLQSCTLETKFMNTSNCTIDITIYDYLYRQDTASTIDPLSDWTYSDDYTKGTTVVNTNPGISPFTSTEFCSKYLVTKVYRMHLASGATHVHTLKHHLNKFIKLSNWVDNSGAQRYKTGGTMVVVLGGMANDVTTKSQISYAACAVDVIQELSFTGYITLDSGRTIQQQGTLLPQAFTVNANIMEEDTDAIDLVVNA